MSKYSSLVKAAIFAKACARKETDEMTERAPRAKGHRASFDFVDPLENSKTGTNTDYQQKFLEVAVTVREGL